MTTATDRRSVEVWALNLHEMKATCCATSVLYYTILHLSGLTTDRMRSSTATALLLLLAACLAGVNARQLSQTPAFKFNCYYVASTICYVRIQTDGDASICRACSEFAGRNNAAVTCGAISADPSGIGARLLPILSVCYVHIQDTGAKCKAFADRFSKQGVRYCDAGPMTSDKLLAGPYTQVLPSGGP
jgi:hypothetical protein